MTEHELLAAIIEKSIEVKDANLKLNALRLEREELLKQFYRKNPQHLTLEHLRVGGYSLYFENWGGTTFPVPIPQIHKLKVISEEQQ